MSTKHENEVRHANWLIALPLIAWAGNALYALGEPQGWIKDYSPALVASALIAYVFLHGRARYGGRTLGRFVLIVFAIAWISETISMITGFPFGNYHYTEIMAPYLWHVPVFVLPAYALMGYASWSLACLVLDRRGAHLDRFALLCVPLLAATAMVIWDLSMDPLRATLEGRWVWLDGGAHLGVPISNYLGWFGVTWLMFQSFAAYLYLHPKCRFPKLVRSRAYWISVPLAYSAFAGEYLLNPVVGSSQLEMILINQTLVPTRSLYADVAGLCLSTMIPLAALGLVMALRSSASKHLGTPQGQKEAL
ncbi:MAG: carotenoid biosynthesis protein [Hyphomicrobiales bacterium]